MSEITRERILDVRVVSDGATAGRVEFELSGGRVASIGCSIEKLEGEFGADERFKGPRGNIDPDPVGSTSDSVGADSPNVEGGSGDAETDGTMIADGVEGETSDESPAEKAEGEPAGDAEPTGEGAATEEATEEAPAPPKGRLPEDFPGHAALDAAGIHTYGQLRKALEGGVKIHGIGSVTQEKIEEALAASPEE